MNRNKDGVDDHTSMILSDQRNDLARLVASLLNDLEKSPKSSSSAVDNNSYGVSDRGLNLLAYWRVIWKRKWLIMGITLLITTMVAVYLIRKPNIYEAKARVEIDLETVNPALGGGKTGSIIFNNPVNYPAYFNTQLKILAGSGLIRRVVKSINLQNNDSFNKTLRNPDDSPSLALLRVLHLANKKDDDKTQQVGYVPLDNTDSPLASSQQLEEAAKLVPYVEKIQDDLKVDAVKETGLSVRETYLIDVSYTHEDKQVATSIVNALCDAFVRSNLEKKTQANSTTGQYLLTRIAELQTRIRTGEEQLASYAKNHQILSLDGSQNTVVERLAGLNKQLLEAENERKEAEAEYRASLAQGAASALAEDALRKSDDRHLTDIDNKLVDLRQRRAQLLVENTEEWPEVKEINKQITELEKQSQDARNRAASLVVTNLETRYKQALDHEKALQKSFDEQRGNTLVQNDAAINYRIIQQEVETNKNLLDGLLQRSKENDVVMAGTPNNMTVVDYAIAPRKPIGPNRFLGVTLAFMLSLALSVGLSLLLEFVDHTVRTVDDVERVLGLPAIGFIPFAGAEARVQKQLRSNILPTIKGDKNQTELLTDTTWQSPLAEAYRQLRTSVLLSQAGSPPKSLLVTSSYPSEGKTTTAVNTAFSLAHTGAKVLIIDADLRRPRLHSIFGVPNKSGLSSILSKDLSEAESFGIIKQHKESSLYVLTSGPVPPNPAELLGSEQMRRLISHVESSFTHIVVDSPPISSFTDGVLLSSLVDGVLLVIHSGKSSQLIAKRSVQLLQDVGANILGVVLNNVKLSSQDYGYYKEYYKPAEYDFVSDETT
jgi:capsular exopolysaccharide synthesis family protein